MTRTHNTPDKQSQWLFRASAILWVIWGLVHLMAGLMTTKLISSARTAEAMHGILSAVELSALELSYTPAIEAVLLQHAFNLGWFGLVTVIAGVLVWRRSTTAVMFASIVGGLADTGYFLYVDLGGFALPPGPQMTWICAAAILTGVAAAWREKRGAETRAT